MKLRLHPLFWAVGIACALFGGLPTFVIYALTALLHECGHIFCANRMGYDCKSISLMPYGAAAVIDLDGISAKDEALLALCGPMVNAALCVLVAGLWWFFPITYAFTDVIMTANASMLAVNLLPAYPLDGGRVVRRLLQRPFGLRAAEIITRVMAGALAVGFIVLCILTKNPSALFMGLFLLCSALEKPQSALRLQFGAEKRLKRGLEVKYVMAHEDITYRQAIKHLEDSRYLVLQITATDGTLEEITQDELYQRLQGANLYQPVLSDKISFDSGLAET